MNDSGNGKRKVNGLIEMVDALVRGGAIDQLSKRETKVWLALRVHADNDTGNCYPSLDTLAALATRGDRANLCKVLNSLIGKGFARKVSAGGGTGNSTRYQVTLPKTVVNSTTDRDALDAGNSGQSDPATVVNSTLQTVVNSTTGTPHITPHETPHTRCKPRRGVYKGGKERPGDPQATSVAEHYRKKWEARHRAPCPWGKKDELHIADLIRDTGDRANATIDAFFSTSDQVVIDESHPLRLLVGPKRHKYLAQAAQRFQKRTLPPEVIRDVEVPDAPPARATVTQPEQSEPVSQVPTAATVADGMPEPPVPPEPITTPDPPGFLEYWNGWPEGPRKADRDDCRRAWDKTGAEMRTPDILAERAALGDLIPHAAPLSLIEVLADGKEAA